MNKAEIVLPFVTFINIRKPIVLDTLEDMYDFIIPFVNIKDERPFHLYFQANVDTTRLLDMSHAETIRCASDSIMEFVNEYIHFRNGEIRLGKLNTNSPFSIESILDVVLFKTPYRKTILGTYIGDNGKALPTVNLKLPRGTTMFISAVNTFPDENITSNSMGNVNIFGCDCLFFFRKNTCNLARHISKVTMQAEFEKAMYESFSYLANTGNKNMPWDAKLEFTK